MSTTSDYEHDLDALLEEIYDEEGISDRQQEVEEEEVDEFSEELVADLVVKCLVFIEYLAGHEFFGYQRAFAARIIDSMIRGDGEELTALFSRQSGKSETVANTMAGLMILLPILAKSFPDLLGKFKDGLWVGCFAPTADQAETLHGRIISRLTSERALEIMMDPEINDAPKGGGTFVALKRNGSFARMQTANPRAKIESKSYHVMVIDEAQECDDYVVRKSVHPMGAFYNATIVKTGTPARTKGDFYKAIQRNRRRETRRGSRRYHFQADWRECAKYNKNYAKFIKAEILRIGEDSDEFRMSYALVWMLERGMFTTSQAMDDLGDKSMEIVRSYWKTPIVVGIDPARKTDSTVVTAVYVDWDRPDEFGLYDHRILNWLEIHGEEWESQYDQITAWCRNYDVMAIAVDAQGIGQAVAERLQHIMPHIEVHPLLSTLPAQNERWTHLLSLMQRGLVSWPAHAKTRRLKTWRRFYQQMVDLEKVYKDRYLLAAAPNEAEAHDDYPDSLALACALTRGLVMPEIEVDNNMFMSHRSR